jgi:lipoprotein-releasing system permease protein
MSRTAAWIGLRYLRARSENRFVGFISVIAMAGIALGVMVLIAVLSVMNGFERDLSRRILDIVAHATIEGDGGRLDDWRGILEKTRGATGVVAIAPFIEARMLVAAILLVDLCAVLPEIERRVSAPGPSRADSASKPAPGGSRRTRPAEKLAVCEWRRGSGRDCAGKHARRRRAAHAPVHGRGFHDAGMYELTRDSRSCMDDARRLYRLGDGAPDCATGSTTRMPRAASVLPNPARLLLSATEPLSGNFFRSIQVTKSIMFFVAARNRGRASTSLRRS